MAKTAPKASKKKVNKKVKRSVRKTFAAVFMITAIVVAAIPVPENVASSGGTTLAAEPNYEYPTNIQDINIVTKINGVEVKLNDTTAPRSQALTLRQGSDDRWQLNWQFEYYMSNGFGVISKYNSEYKSENVVLNPNVFTAYEKVETTVYDSFYAGAAGSKIYEITYEQCIGGTIPSEVEAFFTKYREEAFTTFKEECQKYKTDLDSYDPAEGGTPPQKPNNLTYAVSDLSSTQKLQYYCDQSGFAGATLTEVFDLTQQSAGTDNNKLIYMPKGGDDTQRQDSNGFWYDNTKTAKINAIGNSAFDNVKNVDILTLPDEIKFIGDDAFHDSFIEAVNFVNVESIGNRAFKGCTRLEKVDFGSGLVTIGTEAFYATPIKSVKLPYSVSTIAGGSFAKCTKLGSVDLSAIGSVNSEIKEAAFYDCVALSEVKLEGSAINSIGDGAFALGSGETATLESFVFPSTIATAAQFGDYILAGRGRLKEVTLPADYGRSQAVEVPVHTLQYCINLDWLIFPDDGAGSCGLATYKPALVANIVNPDFCVRGPEKDRLDSTASPRKSTWASSTVVSKYVPYVYNKNGTDYYEVSDGTYLLAGNANGELVSCTLIDPTSSIPIDLVIPSKVGNYPITSIASGCIGDEIKANLRTLEIVDESLQSIDSSVFSDCPNLTSVSIGNSVNSIGNDAFGNCPKLTDVTFHTPMAGYDGFSIGQDAFVTGSSKLTFHADIMKGYAPFEWAMNPANYANSKDSIRVCYKSLEPTNMTVMLDNDTNLPTLVDYPRYNDIDTDNADFIADRIAYFDVLYSPLDVANNPEHAAWNTYKNTYSISGKYEAIYEQEKTPTWQFEYLSADEEQIVNATKNIVVPAGVDSIDIFGFYKSSKNTTGIAAYNLLGNADKKTAYTQASAKDDVIPGLFSGSYRDYPASSTAADEYEKLVKGNDRVESITLNTVQKLPDYAFDSCERLAYVDLGQCTDIGLAPFRGCTSMNTVVGNDNLISYKGIIYEANGDGTYTIITCLGTRGNGVGEASISSKTDSPYIDNVSRIEESAFEDCAYIGSVNLENTKKLRTIPKYCFKNCDNLLNVVLPDSVDTIQDEAFKDNKKINVTIPDVEVEIATSAFEHNTSSVTLYSYEDSAVERYAKQYNVGFEALDGRFSVDFLDHDGTQLSERQYVLSGNAAKEPANPVRDGYNFTGWGPSVSNMKPSNITADVTFIAQYKQKDTGNNNNNNNNNNKDDDDDDDDKSNSDNNKNKTYTVTVINGSGSGSYTKDETVTITANAPATGRKFDRWETSSLNVSMANVKATTTTFKMPKNNVVVTATYDSGTGNNTSGSGGSSGSSSSSTNKRPGSSTSGNNTTTSTVTGSGTRQNGTTVAISKPGISNTGLASAVVDGSSDNFVVRITEDPQATAAVERALIAEYGSLDSIRYFPMDISLYDSTGTVKITDTAGLAVNITMPIPDDLITYAGNNKAGAVVGDSTLEKLGATFKTIDGVPCISFLATHFSPYTVYVDTNNLTAGMDSSPKTGDGIHPKWFLAMGLASLSVVLFIKKDKKTIKLA